MEIKIIEWIQNVFGQNFDNFFKFITKFGEIIPVIIVFLLIYWCYDNKTAIKFLTVCLTAIMLNSFIKRIFKRPRPYLISENIIDKYGSKGYSFTSGHSVNATTTFGGYYYLTKKKQSKMVNAIFLTFSVCIILLVMFSRLYLGQHYLSDVVCGTLFAILWLYVASKLYNLLGKNDHIKLLIIIPIALIICLFSKSPFLMETNIKNIYVICGLIVGVVLGYFIDREYIKFDEPSTIKLKLLKLLIGVFIVAILSVLIVLVKKPLILQLAMFILFGVCSTAGTSIIYKTINQSLKRRKKQ